MAHGYALDDSHLTTLQRNVTMNANCPRCSHPDAEWHGLRLNTGGTYWRLIKCLACEEV